MIAKIEGVLMSVEQDAALVRLGVGGPGEPGNASSAAALTYAVLLPAFAVARLGNSIGQHIELHTLYTIDSQGQGTTLFPRLLGFLTVEDRRFFELFTTCKGIGARKALRAMTLETGLIAAAIADRDAATLQSLPEIGKRTAETIIATLRGKVDRFVAVPASVSTDTDDAASGRISPSHHALAREALEVLLQLGENRLEALAWIDKALASEDPPRDAEQLIAQVYLVKSGAL